MEEQTAATSRPRKKYVRKRRTDLALESALRDAAAATERQADGAVLGLIQTRLNILNQQLTRERNDKIKRALAEIEKLRAENERLKAELARVSAPSPDHSVTGAVTSEIAAALARYQGGKDVSHV